MEVLERLGRAAWVDLWSGERAFGRADAQRRNGLKGEEVLRNPGGLRGPLEDFFGLPGYLLRASWGPLGSLLSGFFEAFWSPFGPVGGSRSVFGGLEELLRVKGPQETPRTPPRTPQEPPLGAPFRADACPKVPRQVIERESGGEHTIFSKFARRLDGSYILGIDAGLIQQQKCSSRPIRAQN